MNTVNKNIIANYAGKLWGFVSIFLFIRLYIDILGIQAYAIISFYTVILGLLAFADSGLTATLTRELAKESTKKHKSDLLLTFEKIYGIICVAVIVGIILGSNYIASNFLQSNEYSPSQISYFVKLMGIGIGFQLFSTLYDGGLMGLQRQVLSNKIRIIWSLFRSGIVVLPLYFSPKLETYFYWQIICNVVLLFAIRHYLWKELELRSEAVFSKIILNDIWKYALGMMGIAFISAINIQIDKMVTSKLLDLKSFGLYSLATTIAQLPLLAVTPIASAVFPIFTNAVSTNRIDVKIKNFHKFSFLIAIITAPIVACVFLYAVPLVTLWTGDATIATKINLVIKVLIIGGMFLCLQIVPFYIALANGYTKINIIMGVFGLFLVIPLIFYCVKNYGMIGATIPWLIINFISFFILSIVVITKFLPNQLKKWAIEDNILPLITTTIIAGIVYFCTQNMAFKYMFIIDMCLITTLSLLINILLYNNNNKLNKLIDFSLIKSKIVKNG